MDGKSISGSLKVIALFVCMSFLFSGALTAFSDGVGGPGQGNGPVVAEEGGAAPAPGAGGGSGGDAPENWWGGPNERGNDIFVPGSFWYIRDAVAAALPGDRILVDEPLLWEVYTEGALVIDKALTIQGMGAEFVTIESNGTGDWMFDVQSDDVKISGFTLVPNRSGIRIANADNCHLEDLVIPEAEVDGINIMNGSENAYIHNNTINSAKTAIGLNHTTGADILENRLTDQRKAIVIDNSTDVEIGMNHIHDTWCGYNSTIRCWQTEGIGIWVGPNSSSVYIQDNVIEDSQSSAVSVDSGGLNGAWWNNTYEVYIEENMIQDFGRYGVNVTNGSSSVFIWYNRINSSWYDEYDGWGYGQGVRVRNATNVEVEDNEIFDVEWGIGIHNGSAPAEVEENIIHDCDEFGLWIDNVTSLGLGTRSDEAPLLEDSVHAVKNDIRECGEGGVLMTRSDSVHFGTNVVDLNYEYGLCMHQTRHSNITTNTIHSTGGGTGLYMDGRSDHNRIEYNDIRFNHFAGMTLYGNVGNTIMGNHVNANGLEPETRREGTAPGGRERGARLSMGEPPDPPENLRHTFGDGIIMLEWDEPYMGSSPIEYYHIYRGTDPGAMSPIGTMGAPLGPATRTVVIIPTWWDDWNVTNGVTYYYYVTAENMVPLTSDPSDTIAAVPGIPPGEPTDVDVTYGDGWANVVWDEPTYPGDPPSVTGYSIYRGLSPNFDMTEPIAHVDAGTRAPGQEYNDTSVEDCHTYYYMVCAANAAGEGEPGDAVHNEMTATSPWSQFMGDAQHTGQSVADTAASDGTVHWAFDTEGTIASNPTIAADGTIYVTAFESLVRGPGFGGLFAVLPNGTMSWVNWTMDELWNAPVVGDDGRIFLLTYDPGETRAPGEYGMVAFYPDGTHNWTHYGTGSYYDTCENIAYGNDTLFFPWGGYLQAVYPENGTLKWNNSANSTGMYAAPAVDPDSHVYTTGVWWHGGAYFENNGSLDWQIEQDDSEYTSMAVHDGRVFYALDSWPSVDAYFTSNGTLNWSFEIEGWIADGTSPTIGPDGTVYVPDGSGYMLALYPGNGTLKWAQYVDDVPTNAAVASEGTVYFGTDGGYVYALYANGTLKWAEGFEDSFYEAPSIGANGVIYIGGDSGYLYAIGGPAPSEPTDLQVEAGPGVAWLQWGPPEEQGHDEASEYRIYRVSVVRGPGELIGTVDGGTFTFADLDAPMYETVEYYLYAVNSAGEGDDYAYKAVYIPGAPYWTAHGIELRNEEGAYLADNHFSNPYMNTRDVYYGSNDDPNVWEYNWYGDYTGVDTDGNYVGEEAYTVWGRNWAINESMTDTMPRTKVEVTDHGGGGGMMSTMMIQSAVTDVGSSQLGDDLVAHWKLDEAYWNGTAGEIIDHSGNGHHGVRHAQANTTWDPEMGMVGRFNGTTDYADLMAFDINNDFTVSLWVDPETTDDGQCFVGKHDGSGNNQFLIGYWAGRVEVNVGGSPVGGGEKTTGWQQLTAVGRKVPGSWQTDVSVFRNGTLLWRDTVGDAIGYIGGGKAWVLGQDWDGGSTTDFFEGNMSDVRIWNRALTIGEAEDLYNVSASLRTIGHWKFDEAAWDGTPGQVLDKSGYLNHGTAVNGADTVDDGKFHRAGDFESGTSTRVNAGNFGGGAGFDTITISAWIKTAGGDNDYILSKDGSGSNDGDFSLRLVDDEITTAGGAVTTDLAGPDVSDDQWHHVAFVLDPATGYHLYVDGVLADTNDTTGGVIWNNTFDLTFGTASAGTYQFNGYMDDIRIYNRVLEPLELRALACVPTTIAVPGDIDGYYYETVRIENRTDLGIAGFMNTRGGGYDGYYNDLPNVTCHYDWNANATFLVNNCTNVTLDSLLTYGGRVGMMFTNTAEPNLLDCVAYNASVDNWYAESAGAWFEDTTDARIDGNHMYHNVRAGMMVEDSRGFMIEHNDFSMNGRYRWMTRDKFEEYPWYSGLILRASENGTITENDACDNWEHGILLDYSHNNDIVNNTATGNRYRPIGGGEMIVRGARDESSQDSGIILVQSRDCWLTLNRADDNGIGIWVKHASDGTEIVHNFADRNSDTGIMISESLVYEVRENVLYENQYEGIYYDFLNEGGGRSRYEWPEDTRNRWSYQFRQPVNITDNEVYGDYSSGDDSEGIYVANVGRHSAHGGTNMWYSGSGPSYVGQLSREIDLTGLTDPYMTFWGFYDLADSNDYLFINVSDDLTPPRYYTWNLYTVQGGGMSEDWTRESIDLGQFAGDTIWIRFQYVTDLFSEPNHDFWGGWWIDDIRIFDSMEGDTVFQDDMEGGGERALTEYGDWRTHEQDEGTYGLMVDSIGDPELVYRDLVGNWGLRETLDDPSGWAYWMETAYHPDTGRSCVVARTTDGLLRAYVHDGTEWDSGTVLGDSYYTTTGRSFDVEFEDLSGDILVVFDQYDPSWGYYHPHYATNVGGVWSAPVNMYSGSYGTERSIYWVDLTVKRGTDEIAIGTLTTYADVFGYIWTGDGVLGGNDVLITYDAYQTSSKCFDMFYESSTGKLWCVVGCDSSPYTYSPYQWMWNPGTKDWIAWGYAPYSETPTFYYTYNIEIDSHPTTNEAVMVFSTSYWGRLYMMHWNGGGWDYVQYFSTYMDDWYDRSFDVEYEELSGYAHVFMVPDDWGYDQMYEYQFRGPGLGWYGHYHIGTVGYDGRWTVATPEAGTNNILVGCLGQGYDIYSYLTSVSGGTTALSAVYDEVPSYGYKGFDVGWTHRNRLDAWHYGIPSNVGPGAFPPLPGSGNMWGTNLTANYKNGEYYSLETPAFALPGDAVGATLNFDHWLEVETGKHDGGIVEVRTEDRGWKQVDPGNVQGKYSGTISDGDNELNGKKAFCKSTTGWQTVEMVLPSWVAGSEKVQVRYTFASDETGGVDAGWYIDDVNVTGIVADPQEVIFEDDAEDGGAEGWETDDWFVGNRSVIVKDNVVQGTEIGIEMRGNGATLFEDNNVSHNQMALLVLNGGWRRGPEGDEKNSDDVYVFDLDLIENDMSHNTGDYEGINMYVGSDSGFPVHATFTDNVFLYNNEDVFELWSDSDVFIDEFSGNDFMYTTGEDEGPRAGYEGGRGDCVELGCGGSMYIDMFTDNNFTRSADGVYFQVDDNLTIMEFTGNVFKNLYSYWGEEGELPRDSGYSGAIETHDALYISDENNNLYCPEMSENTFDHTRGIRMYLEHNGDRQTYLNFHDNTLNCNGDWDWEDQVLEEGAFELEIDGHRAVLDIAGNTFEHNGEGLNIRYHDGSSGALEVHDNHFDHNTEKGMTMYVYSDADGVAGTIAQNWFNYNGVEDRIYDEAMGGFFLRAFGDTWLDIVENDFSHNFGSGLKIYTQGHWTDIDVETNTITDNTGYYSGMGPWDWVTGGLYIHSSQGVDVTGNYVNDNYGANLVLRDSDECWFEGNGFNDALPFPEWGGGETRNGMYLPETGFGAVSFWNDDNVFRSCTITGNAAHGVYIHDCADNGFYYNTISDNGGDGIYNHNSDGHDLVGNTISGNGGAGYHERWCGEGMYLAGNTIDQNDGDGVHIWNNGFEDYWLVNNDVSNNGGDGVCVEYSPSARGPLNGRLWMTNNNVTNNDGWGAFVWDESDMLHTVWNVTNSTTVLNNPVFIRNGDIDVLAGGTMVTNGAEMYFRAGRGLAVEAGGVLNAFDTVWTHEAFINDTMVYDDSGYWYLTINGSATFSDCGINYTYTVDCHEAQIITLTRTNVTLTQGHGMTLYMCNNVQLDYSHIHHTGLDGVNMKQSSLFMDASWISYCADGIHAEMSTLLMDGKCMIFNNSDGGTGDGIDIYQMEVVEIDGAVIFNNAAHGLRARECMQATVEGSTIFGNGGDGLFLTTCGIEISPIYSLDNHIHGNDAGITATKTSYLDSDRDNLTGNDDGFNILDNSRAWVDDGHLSNTVLDLFVTDGSHCIVTNTDHTMSKTTVQNTGLGTGTELEVRWYIWIAVYDLGAPVNQANVTLNTSSTYMPQPVNLKTGKDGMTDSFTVWGYVKTFTGTDTSMNPHDILVGIKAGGKVKYETAQFTADRTKVVVVGINLPPEPDGSIEPREFNEGDTFLDAIDLDACFDDREPLTYSVSGNVHVTVDIAGDGTVDLSTADENWYGQETLIFKATDSLGQTAQQKVKVTVKSINDPPWAQNVTILPSSPKTGHTLTLDYDWYDVDTGYGEGDNESTPMVYWYKNGMFVTLYKNELSIPSSATTRGDVWYAVLTPRDYEGLNGTGVRSPNATIGNTAPSVKNATLEPAAIYVTTNVMVVPDGWKDPDPDDEQGYKYRWQVNRNGVWEYIPNRTASVLPAGLLSKGDQVRAHVTPSDGHKSGTPVFSDAATVLNSPPTVHGVSITPPNPTKTQTLTAVVAGALDADGDPVKGYNHTWYVNGNTVAGQHTDELTADHFDSGDSVFVEVSATDGENMGEPAPSRPVTILNTPPTISQVLLSPGSPDDDDNITALPQMYYDADGDKARSYDVTWYINSHKVEGATNLTLPADLTEIGEVVFVVVRPYDGEDHGPGLSSSSVKIRPVPPDEDGDGIPDNEDNDIDGDGVLNEQDAFPFDSGEQADFDGDGIGDAADEDDDNDGIPDEKDAFDRDPTETTDTDEDGIGDNSDNDIDGDGSPNEDDPEPYNKDEDSSISRSEGVVENAFNLALIALLMFFILALLMFMLMNRRKERSAVAAWDKEMGAAAAAKEVEDMKGMSKCSECGSVIPAEAEVCPDCGADFSEDDEDEGMEVEEEEDLDEDEE